jgi:iron complex outermembrane receptor protein
MRKLVAVAALVAAPAALVAQGRDTARVRHDSAAPQPLEAVTVRAIRAHESAPVSAKTVTAAEIERRSFGQDVPLVLQGTPSLTSYAETGNYWGYSYIRMRGIDQSRINLTIDGIPLNDPEDQVLYFADFPDLTASINSIQIQRGVGTSAPGTASYGGSINFQTIPVAGARRAGGVQLQGGSFGSARASAEYATGLTSGRFATYARLSALQSEGYRRHSGTEGRSGFFSAAYVGDRDVLKLTALAGLFADTLAYVGATPAELAQDRRFNPLRPDETDRFGEQVAALSYTRTLSPGSSASATVYRISASGNYDVCISNCDQPAGDLWNFHLDFAWYGATAAWTLERGRARLDAGANANTYARDHYAYARPDFANKLYLNTGHKDDASAFAKLSYDVGTVTLFGDVQGRRAEFRYTPDANAGISGSAVSWTFLNPKVGATLRLAGGANVYASFGLNAREPARSDMLGGFDNLDTSNAAFVGPFDRIRPERAHDLEGGIRLRGAEWSLDANAFAMEFRNEILPIGRLTYIGTPLRANVRSSWRRGVEADFSARPAPRLGVDLTATAMRARIAEFTDEETGRSYRDVEPLLTPRFLTSQRLSLDVTRSLSVSATGRYQSRSQLTNTGDATLVLPSYYTIDAAAQWTRGAHGITLHVNNVTDARRYGGGHVGVGGARYYVLPPPNLFLLARVGM